MTPLLSLESLRISIGERRIIDDVSLTVESGEILGLVGASGSGKSMTALAIMRLLPASAHMSGVVRLRGALLSEMTGPQLQRVRGRALSMIFQEPMTALNPRMRIGDQVSETVRLHRSVTASVANALAHDALDAVGLSGLQGALDRYPHELSGGQRQRVAIAIAVVLEPWLLIADEPTTALDVRSQSQILTLLRELARSRNMGLILVSHDLAVIAQITDRIAVMQEGVIVEEAATSASLGHLRHPYSKALRAAAELLPRPRNPVIKPLAVVLDVRDVVLDYASKRRTFWGKTPAFRAIDGASLVVRAGETVGLVGESGSGKSSLLRVVLALERPRSGEVRLLGEDFPSSNGRELRGQRRCIQAVFQDPYGSFDPAWSVERLVAEPFFLMDTPLSAGERRNRVAVMLERVGLTSADAMRHPHEFSGGQRQRIAIARALVIEPAVIVFDEAVSALDVLVRAQILDLLAELSRRSRLAYLFVSHDLNMVRAVADRIYVMQRGRIVEEASAVNLFASPQHAYTRSLIESTPQLQRDTVQRAAIQRE